MIDTTISRSKVESTHMSMNYDVQTDTIGLDQCPSFFPILTVIFGKPVELHINYYNKEKKQVSIAQERFKDCFKNKV